jgi:transposase InsO family protein
VYLSPIIYCCDGLVISWSIGTQADAELVNTMLDAAIETVTEAEERPIVHSDRGAHHRWPGRLTRISEAKLVRSISRKRLLARQRRLRRLLQPDENRNLLSPRLEGYRNQQFVAEVDDYIRCYNEKRIKISLNKRALAHIFFQFYRSDLNTCRLVRRISVC